LKFEQIDSRIRRVAENAGSKFFRGVSGHLTVLSGLELRRLEGILSSPLEVELSRAPFEIIEVEARKRIEIGGHELLARVDRLDRLENGSLVVVDYKTGASPNVSSWFSDRPRDVQIPVYAGNVSGSLSGTVFCVLHSDSVSYKGLWNASGTFPGRSSALPTGRTWRSQQECWREQVEALVAEYVAGDGRIFLDQIDAATGIHAPLTRVYDVLAEIRDGLN